MSNGEFYYSEGADIKKWGGVEQTGADLTPHLENLDIALSVLRDAIVGSLVQGENDYDYQEIDLGTARADVALTLSGTSLTVKDLTGTASIKFGSTAKPALPLANGEVYEIRFDEVYLTNAAQAGQELKLFIGRGS